MTSYGRFCSGQNWSDDTFTREKTYVAALFAEMAYWHIPELELQNHERIKIVPCFAYQTLARRGDSTGLETLLRQCDIARPIIIVRRYAVILIFALPTVIFVAIRGTKYLYDWVINLNAARYMFDGERPELRFHRGFFRAIAACFQPIAVEVSKLARHDTPIYVAGHSLGGAMAAIMHAILRFTTSAELLAGGNVVRHTRSSTATFTFGMPRYGNAASVTTFRNPYHVYNVDDIVPTVRLAGVASRIHSWNIVPTV